MLEITITGLPKSGKTAAAQRVRKALEQAGMSVTIEDVDGDFHYYRPNSVLAGKDVSIKMTNIPLQRAAQEITGK